MNQPAISVDRNPFATRHVRPGAIRYRFGSEINAAGLVGRLAAAGWRGQIVGPHGSGKSTLLATLLPLIESSGRRPRLIALHDGQRRLPERLDRKAAPAEPAIIVVDGFEQLAPWHRWRLLRRCRRRGWGLLATAHRSVGLPTIFETSTTPQLAQGIVAELARDGWTIEPAEIAARFDLHGGNLRELLFDCYDLYRRRISGQQSQPGGRGQPEDS